MHTRVIRRNTELSGDLIGQIGLGVAGLREDLQSYCRVKNGQMRSTLARDLTGKSRERAHSGGAAPDWQGRKSVLSR